jgi:hypothetical protein
MQTSEVVKLKSVYPTHTIIYENHHHHHHHLYLTVITQSHAYHPYNFKTTSSSPIVCYLSEDI